MKRKTILIAPLAAMALGAAAGLASCGGQKQSSLIDLSVDTRGEEITFWTGFGASITAKLESLLDQFEKDTGIHVIHEGKGGYDNLQKAINGSASSQTYANVAVGYPDHFAGYVDSDILLRLDEFIEQDKTIPETRIGSVTDKEDAESTFYELPKFDLNDFYPSYLVENQSIEYKEDGTGYTLGIPFNKSTEVMVYNKSFFDLQIVKDAGIVIPATWDDVATQTDKIINFLAGKDAFTKKVLASDGNFYDSAEAVAALNTDVAKTDEGYVRVVLDLTKVTKDDFHPLSYDSQANFFITGMRQWGGVYTTVDKVTRRGSIHFHEGDYAFNFLYEMNEIYKNGGLGIPSTWGEQSYCSTPFKNFKSVMNIGSSAGVSNSLGAPAEFNVSCAPIPYHVADRRAVISQGTNLGVFDVGTTAQKAAAWKLVKYLTQVKNGDFAAMTGYFPACKTAAESETYQDFLAKPKSDEDKLNVAAARVNLDYYDKDGWTKFVDPGFVGSSTIRTDVDTITGEVFYSGEIRSILNQHKNNLRDYLEEE